MSKHANTSQEQKLGLWLGMAPAYASNCYEYHSNTQLTLSFASIMLCNIFFAVVFWSTEKFPQIFTKAVPVCLPCDTSGNHLAHISLSSPCRHPIRRGRGRRLEMGEEKPPASTQMCLETYNRCNNRNAFWLLHLNSLYLSLACQ